jgi:acyl dehydratase
MTLRYFEDFQVGDTFELGSKTVTEEEIINFARKYDPQPFHVDPERAKSSFYGGLIASGWHTAGIYMRLLVDGFLTQSLSMGSPGLDDLRWLKPVRPGDTLSARFIVVDVIPSRSKPTIGVIKGKGEVLNQKGEVVMSLSSAGFFGRRPDE